jgi:hypothetical protein
MHEEEHMDAGNESDAFYGDDREVDGRVDAWGAGTAGKLT